MGCACLDELTEQCLNRQAHPSTPHAGIATPTLQASPTICLVKPTCVQPHPTVLYGHAHPPALTRLPRSSHAHPSRPVTPIRLATPTQPVWSVPSTCPALLPRSGHAYLSVQLRPPCPATPTLSSYIRPLSGHVQPCCPATPTHLSSHAHIAGPRPPALSVSQVRLSPTLINAAVVLSRRCAVWRLHVVLSWLQPLHLERGNKDRAETLWLFQKIKYF